MFARKYLGTMIRFHFLLGLFLCALAEGRVSYKNYRIYQVTEDRNAMPTRRTMESGDREGPIVLKTQTTGIKDDSHVVRSYLVSRDDEESFVDNLKHMGANFSLRISDLGRLIDQEKRSSESSRRRLNTKLSHLETYFSYPEIVDQVEKLSQVMHPEGNKPIAVLEKIGHSYENRDLYLVKISSNHSAMKPIVFFEAGMHAREWLAPATALNMIYELVDNFTGNQKVLENVDFYIVPLSNPDGYEYTRTTDRLWRKTRSTYRTGYGTDGNRNFDYHWGEHGSSDDPESETFAGPKAFSEIETRTIRDVGIKYRDRLIMFLSIHAYGALFVYPWSYARTKPAPYTPEMERAARAAVRAIEKYSGTKYTVGNSAKLMYDSPGGADDYFKGVLGIEMSLTLELSADREESFIVPAKKIRKIVTEAFEGIKAISNEAYLFHMAEGNTNRDRHTR